MNDGSRNTATGDGTSADKTPGELLQAQREKRKLDLHSAARDLHVDTWILEALEKDEYEQIGAPIFIKGHLRNYARLLGLQAEPLLSAFEEIEHPTEPGIGLQQPWGQSVESRLPQGWLHSLAWLLAAVIIALAGSWLYMRIAEQERVTEADMQTTAPVSVTARPVPENALPANEPGDSLQVDAALAGDAAGADIPAVNVVLPESETPAENLVPVNLPSDGSGALMALEIVFDGQSWLEIQEGTGKRLYYDLIPGGTTLQVSGVAPLVLYFGNAPVVSLSVNGSPLDIGSRIRRDNTARVLLEGNASSPQDGSSQ